MPEASFLLEFLLLVFSCCRSFQDTQEWHMVFKVSTGGDFGIYNLYTSNDSRNECNVEARKIDGSTTEHYKSKLIRIWDTLDVYKVKVSIYKDSEEKQFLVFNGTGSTAMDWFRPERLIDSSYDLDDLQGVNTSLAATGSFFSIEGHYVIYLNMEVLMRRFYINRSYGGCGVDYGWMVVIDGYSQYFCNIDLAQNVSIYYSVGPTFSWFQDYILADSMAVYVTGDSIPCYCCSQNITNILPAITAPPVSPEQTTSCPKCEQTCQTFTETRHVQTNNEFTTSSTVASSSTDSASRYTATTTVERPVTVDQPVTQTNIIKIKEDLSIPKNSTGNYWRSKISAYDPRYSAKVVGHTLGTGVLILVACVILIPDIYRLVVHIVNINKYKTSLGK